MIKEEDIRLDYEPKRQLICIHFGKHPHHYSLLRSIQALFVGDTFRVQNVLYIKSPVPGRKVSDYLPDCPDKYNSSLRLLSGLSAQIQFLLEKEHKCFYTFDFDRVFVLNDGFCYLSANHLKPCGPATQQLEMLSVPERNTLLAPEIRTQQAFPPFVVLFKCIYYSLGLLVLRFLNLPSLEKLKGTKLFACLQRCMDANSSNRTLVYF
jgi:hypothetical protein